MQSFLLSVFFTFLLFISFRSNAQRWIEKRKEIIRNDTVLYFYKDFSYGVQDLYNPAYMIVNGGFDIMQLGGYSREVEAYDWRLNSRNVFENIIDPFQAIKAASWKTFLTTEVFPLNYTSEGGQWIPNYFLHFLNGGMQYRMMTEWYRAHNVPVPKIFSVATVFSMHFLNEIMENNNKDGLNVDPIADVYLFNVAGIFLFNSIPVSRFFSEKLNMADWSLMPTFSFRDLSIQNAGQYVIYKFMIPRNEKWGVFWRWGMGTQAGVTYVIKNENAITAAGGIRSGDLELLQEEGKIVTTTFTWSAFFAWDKNNTPLVTLNFSGKEDHTALLNVYPGVLKIRKFSPGIWAVAGRDGTGAFGICARYTLGLGVGFGWK